MNKQFCPYCMTPTIEGEACPNCGLTAGTYSPNQNHLPPGTILNDRYLVGRALGEGGFGITYIGCDLRLELKVAIKEYYPSDKVQRISTVSLDVSVPSSYAEKGFLSGKDRFLDEARVMARMDKQPEIVSVRDFFECHNTAYIVMEYVEGTTFKQMVAQRGGGIPPQELFPMLEPLFGALTNLHALGLIHRDISPDNLMLERGHVRLIDFGCARQPEKGEATMTIVLKHGYAPIEQYTNKGQGPWTDVYALSATIYYCLVGQTPPQAMDRAVDDDLILPRKLGVDLTEAQEKALLYGMGVKRRQRFASVAELYAALYKQAPTPEPEPVPVPVATLEYPVTGESERTMPAKPVITVTGEEPKAKTEEQPEETPEDKPEKPRKKKRPWWDNPLIGIGIAAAIVLLIALSLLLPGDKPADLPEDEPALEGEAAPDSEPTDAPSAEAPARTEVQLPPDDPFANAIELFPPELLDMAEQLDNGADYVTVPEFQYGLNTPYTLKGHLRIVEGSTMNFNQMVIVPKGVVLQVEGILHAPEGILVEEGGWLSILGTGEVRDGDVILYDMESAMSACSPIAVQNSQDGTGTRFMDLKQTDYHRERATHVTSAEELLRAAEDLHTVMIVVDDTVTLEEHVTVTVPLVISEGATLHIPDDGTDDPVALTLQAPGSLLNHGTLNGMVFTHAVDGRAPAPMLNYAKMYIRGWFGADSTTIFNMAELSARHWVHLYGGVALYNRGTLHVDDGNLTVGGGMLRNCGEIIVDAQSLEVGGSGLFTNDGSLTVKAGGTFANRSHSNSSGTIALQSGSRLENDGVLGLYQPLQAAPDVPIANSGLIITPGYDVSVTAGESPGRVMKLNHAPHETDGDYVSVATKAEFYDALNNDSVGFIEVNDEIELTQDVTLTKNMAINGTLSLAGNVHLEIQSAVHVNGSLVSYNGGTIGVSEGGILMNYGEIVCPRLLLGEENIMENSGFFHNEGTLNAFGADVELHGESALMNWGRMEEVGHLLIGSGSVVAEGGSSFDSLNTQRMTVDGILTSINPLDLTNAEITVNGQFRTYGNSFSLNGSSSLMINEYGITDCLFTAWYLNDSSRIENRGEMHFFGFHEFPVTLNSAMYNYGSVQMGVPLYLNWYLRNDGEFRLHNTTADSLVSWGPDGNVEGNPLVPKLD